MTTNFVPGELLRLKPSNSDQWTPPPIGIYVGETDQDYIIFWIDINRVDKYHKGVSYFCRL